MNEKRSGIGRQHALSTHEMSVQIPTQKAKSNIVFVIGCVLALLALYVLGSVLDIQAEQRARAEREALIHQLEEQVSALDEEMALEAHLQTVRDAYERGQQDAMAALANTPKGVALLQACRAIHPSTKKGGV